MNFVLFVGLITAARFTKSSYGDASWYNFATSKSYENTILVLEFDNLVKSVYISKDNSMIQARMKCSQACAGQDTCQSFNIYDRGDAFVCQLLPDNFCAQKWRLTLQIWPGGFVWDKLSPVVGKTCLEQQFQGKTVADFCGIAFSGCRGTWPSCADCVLTCYHCRSRFYSGFVGMHRCTIWPEGPTLRPIFAQCFEFATFVIYRYLDLKNGYDRSNYLMPVVDMGRLSKVKISNGFQLYIRAGDGSTYTEDYRFGSIDATGKITNLSWFASPYRNDGFGLNGQTVSVDFVQIPYDLYGCGSFWLLDPNNATYCPGGKVSLLGTFQKSSSSSGIRWPPAGGKIIEQGDIKLVV